jgi:uncharacterized phage protein (TIGR02218 family)
MNASDIYLFHIIKNSEKEYYLTSAAKKLEYEGNIYLPYSGLSFLSGSFNDSAENLIVLKGVFESSGISKDDDLIGASVKILRMQNNQIKHFVTYFCTQHNINDLNFEIHCEPETIKYNRSMLQMFSRTCRANFGDSRCCVNKNDYAITCHILSINGSIINCNFDDIESGYFTGGKLVDANQKEFLILTHVHHNLEVQNLDRCAFNVGDQITLVPTCDKNFRTCCYSFNNAVNFRGEPAIPESNIVKN